jgi:hypothetical protein
MGDIQSSEAPRLGVGQQIGKRRRVDAEHVQIDQIISAGNSLFGGFVPVQSRRGGLLYSGPNQSQAYDG